jgi:hypothetical protein
LVGFGGGMGFGLIVLSLTLGLSALLLGIGFVFLIVSLVFLQLSFWREGDRTARGDKGAEVCFESVSAPTELQHNPRLMNVWTGMEATRRLMERKKALATEEDKRREKAKLRLSDAEDILLMGEPSFLLFWPLAIVSGVFLLASASSTGEASTSFVCLTVGLGGLLLLHVMKGQTKVYLTSHRVLVRKRAWWKSAAVWAALGYGDVGRWSYDVGFARSRISLTGEHFHLDVKGLPSSLMAEAIDILRENLPAEIMCKNPNKSVNGR